MKRRFIGPFSRLALAVIIAMLIMAWNLAPACAQAEPPTVDEYWQRVDNALAAVRQARSLPPAERAPRLAQAADALEPVSSVRLADGRLAPVDNAALIAALRAENADVDRLEARLAALAQTRRAWPHPKPHANTFDALREVLSRPEFQPAPEREPTWLEQLIRDFNNWLNRLLARLLWADRVSTLGIDWALILVGALTLAGVAYFFWRNVRAHLVREAALAQGAAEARQLSASAAVKQAQTLAAGSDYRQAIRYLYLAALLTLDERGVLRYDRALTNRQVLQRAGQSDDPALAQAMSPVVDIFDRVWYGLAQADDKTYRAYEKQIKRVTDK